MWLRLSLHLALVSSIAAILLAWNYVGAPKTVRVEVDGATHQRETRQVQVAGFLKEAGIALDVGDAVDPPLGASLVNGELVRVTRAIPVALTTDGEPLSILTTSTSVVDVLRDASVTIGPYDEIALDGRLLPPITSLRRLLAGRPTTEDALPLALEVSHARPLHVHDYGLVTEIYTTRTTLQEALNDAGIGLRPGDVSRPPLSTTVAAGQHVYLLRAKETYLWADGRPFALRTFAETVQDLLEERSIRLNSGDRVEPGPATPLREGMGVTVIRSNEERVELSESIPFSTEYVADDSMEVGEQRIRQEGARGLRKRQVRILYENGQEVRRTTEREWIEASPQNTVVHYGTRVVVRTVDTPGGPLSYWRRLRVYATWYAPFSAGKPAGSPGYGITSMGVEVRRGVIAVDPRVIPYGTQLYVPGYGVGVAADTGGGVRGYMLDLGFADDEEHDWSTRWVEAYLLGTEPYPGLIRPPAP